MRDSGIDIQANKRLAKTVQGMMSQWTEDNFVNFQETMDLVREGAPIQWLKIYMEAYKLGIVKENNTNINININRQQDRENLQALVHARIPLPESGSYVPYEEVRETVALPADHKKITQK